MINDGIVTPGHGNDKCGPLCETETSRQRAVGFHDRARATIVSVRNRTGRWLTQCRLQPTDRNTVARNLPETFSGRSAGTGLRRGVRGFWWLIVIHINPRAGRLSKVAQSRKQYRGYSDQVLQFPSKPERVQVAIGNLEICANASSRQSRRIPRLRTKTGWTLSLPPWSK